MADEKGMRADELIDLLKKDPDKLAVSKAALLDDVFGNTGSGILNIDPPKPPVDTMKPPVLMEELAASGVKYTPDDVVMVTKTSDGNVLWLETGNNTSGLKHIIDGNAADFAANGIDDIPSFLPELLNTAPVNTGIGAKGPFTDYVLEGTTYRVAHGTNGYIVSVYPID